MGLSVPGDAISLAAGRYREHSLAIDDDVTISGAGASTTLVNAQSQGRHFTVNATGEVGIRDLTLANGDAGPGGGGAIQVNAGSLRLVRTVLKNNVAADGGAIQCATPCTGLTVKGSTLTDNAAVSDGGAIATTADADVQNTVIESNSAANLGGGIYNYGGDLWVFQTQFSGNESGGSGGGISSWLGTTTVMRSSFVDNSATGLTGLGGAIHFYGLAPSSELRVGNTTFSQNSAQWAGGVVTTSTNTTATMNNVTMVDNTSTMGAQDISVSGTFELSNSIVTHLNGLGFAPSCTAVVPISGQNNLMDAPCPNVGGNWVGPLLAGSLGALANHGGPTLSYILLAGSNGIDTGVNDCPDPLTGNPLPADQRAIARPVGAACDIGAVEQ